MITFEITLQRKLNDYWPTMLTWQADGLEIQREEKLQLDLAELISQPTPLLYGRYLGEALFQGTIRDSFNQAWSQSNNDNPLQVWLTVDDPELKPLQWQRLCFPLDGQWDHLCLYQNIIFSRYITSQSSTPFPPIGRQDMRALVVVANPPNLAEYKLAPFDAAAIIAEIKTALGDIPHDVLTTPSLKALLEQLSQQRYTLLHWVSHGTYNAKKQDTMLYLNDEETNQARPILAREVINQLRRISKQPYFIFLSACESATVSDSEEAIDGFAQRLVLELGIPAVLGMADLISIVTARQLATQFYRHLRAQTTPRIYVDRVLAAAMAGLSRHNDITIPTLYHRLGERPLFDDSWDRPLTATEIGTGLARLPQLIEERAPILQAQFKPAMAVLERLNQTDRLALAPADKLAQAQALQRLNELCTEAFDLSFNALALEHTPPVYDSRCPFLGLQAFDRQEAHFFFGRTELSQQLQQHLAARGGLAVLGPSGSGKSSLVLAGLVPLLQQQTPSLQLVYLTPKHNPVQQLATALQPATSKPQVVVIDQFEEVFTLCTQEAERLEFFNQLLALAQTQPLILTMRVDFFGDCASYPDLNRFMEHCLKNIAPMSHAELNEAMQQQAQVVNLQFEAVLSELILEEVQGEPGKMPLLQHALRVLWQRRHGRWLCLTEYEQLGRVKKAIARTADEIYQQLAPTEQLQLRAIFVRLTHLGQLDGAGYRDSRQRVPLRELVVAPHDLESTRALIHRLVNERLLMTSVDSTSEVEYVEVAHEALIHHWEELRKWLQSNRTALELRQQINQDAREWQEGGRVDSLLPRWNSKLEAALTLEKSDNVTLNELERDYLQACVTLRDKEAAEKEAQRQRELAQAQALAAEQRRRLQWAMGLSVLVAFAALLALWFGYKSNENATLAENNAESAKNNAATAEAEKNNAKQQAQISRSRELAAQANELMTKGDYHTALLVALESERITETVQAFNIIQKGQSALALPKFTLAHKAPVNGASWNKAESQLLTWDWDKVYLWDAKTGRELRHFTHDWSIGGVEGASWDKDESQLLTWSRDNTARLWDANTGQERHRFTHDDNVLGASWNKDESQLLTWSKDKTARLWDVNTGKELHRFTHDDKVLGTSWNKAESQLLTWSDDFTARLWNSNTGKELHRFTHESQVLGASWNKEESQLITWGYDFTAHMWDTKTGKELHRFTHESQVLGASWNKAESQLLTWSDDKTVRLWNATTGQELRRFSHDDTVLGASWNKEESQLLTWSDDKTARLWDANTGQELRRFTHNDKVNGASWNKDESHLLTWSYEDKTARLWDATTGQELRRFTHDNIVEGASWNKDESQLLTWSADGAARLWDTVQTEPELHRFTHDSYVNGASWNNAESQLLTWSADTTARLWDVDTEKELRRFTHDWSIDGVNGASWNKDESQLLTWNDDTVYLWDANTEQELRRFTHDDKVNRASWNNDKSQLLTWSNDKTIRLWDVKTGRELRRFTHDDKVNGASWNNDESQLLTWSDDKTIRLWDVKMGRELRRFTDDDKVNRASWNKDESQLLTWSLDVVYLWDVKTGQELRRFTHDSFVDGASWNKDESQLLTWSGGRRDKTAHLWDANTGQELYRFTHDSVVKGASWNKDESQLLTWSDDKTARLWNAKTGQELRRFTHDDKVNGASWNKDESQLLTWSEDTVRLWPMTMTKLQVRACQHVAFNFNLATWRQYFGDEPYHKTCDNLPIPDDVIERQ